MRLLAKCVGALLSFVFWSAAATASYLGGWLLVGRMELAQVNNVGFWPPSITLSGAPALWVWFIPAMAAVVGVTLAAILLSVLNAIDGSMEKAQ